MGCDGRSVSQRLIDDWMLHRDPRPAKIVTTLSREHFVRAGFNQLAVDISYFQNTRQETYRKPVACHGQIGKASTGKAGGFQVKPRRGVKCLAPQGGRTLAVVP